ncbi:MAG: Protease Do [Candidatus Tokpelaia hoelldobleri]|uniref:Protease Do n=1 Tax=Candidatus Tokpelaia hoelldobleri TaxID=1902579 RepID=A0A1U9JUE9_9HYPH|nr:MAG: Protease Do [Candidatus Tokpelaia hoelldoblerii]
MKQLCTALAFCTLLFTGNAYAQAVPGSAAQMQLSFAPLVKKTVPAVVNVYAARQVQVRSPFAGDPFFEQFFGRRAPDRARIQQSLGSGVIIDAGGLVITNYHVIREADEIRVALSDGREFESKVILKDEATDIAVLKLETGETGFPVLELADSDRVEVGDLVLAIGNPFGVGQTVTSGIVSAQARTRAGGSDYDFFIQTDAAINPGNSGGALIDTHGHLIGVNTAIYSRSGGSIGIGFAIPANLVRVVMESVKRGEDHFEQPYLGAGFQSVTADVAESLGMKRPYGALVTEVMAKSPAAQAGLRVGDVVLTAQGERIGNPDVLGYRLLTTGIGEELPLEILRDGRQVKARVILQAVPAEAAGVAERIGGNSPFAGVEVMNLTAQNTRRFRLPQSTRGVVVNAVAEGENAAMVFAKGDILRVINGAPVNSVADVKNVLSGSAPRFWQLEYERGGVLICRIVR